MRPLAARERQHVAARRRHHRRAGAMGRKIGGLGWAGRREAKAAQNGADKQTQQDWRAFYGVPSVSQIATITPPAPGCQPGMATAGNAAPGTFAALAPLLL